MGANFGFDKIGDLDEKVSVIYDRFKEIQREQAELYGSSYSGAWNMCSHLNDVYKTFRTRDMAMDWLENNTEKWGPAALVKVTEEGHEGYYIGGWRAE